MKRRHFLQSLGATALAAATPSTAFAQPPLNVLFIMADDFNTALSGYGHPQCQTPNLDRLARWGTAFTRAYCQYPVCGPSRASLMSGLYPLTNGVTRNPHSLDNEILTLPKRLRDAGYWTGRVSKIYHMGVPGNIFTGDNGVDHAPSWDERYNVSVMETLTPGAAEDLMLDDSTSTYPDLRTQWPAYRHQGGKFMIPTGNHQGSDFVVVEADPDVELADGLAADKGIDLLRERAAEDQPFFLGVGFVRPHVPLVAPRRSFTRYETEAMQLAQTPPDDLRDIPHAAQRHTNQNRYKLTEENQKKVLRGYYASVTYMDEQVGRLLDEVERLGLKDNTIIVFASDHGYHLGEHTMWQKLSLFEESIRTPLIVYAPGMESSGTPCDELVELVDVFPTLMELTGHDTPQHLQGTSFAHLLNAPGSATGKQEAFVQSGNAYCLRTKQWAYMLYHNPQGKKIGTMLYNMEEDPQQFNNLSGDARYAAIEAGLHQRLQARIESAKEAAERTP